MSIFSSSKPLITFEFMEHLQNFVRDNPETSMLSALQYACTNSKCDLRNAEHIAMRLADEQSARQSAQPAASKANAKGFGTSFLEWYTKLSPDIMCLIASGFDYEKARHLYTMVDKDIVDEVLKAYSESEWNTAHLRFEACLFGFGGGYDKGKAKGGNGNAKSLTLARWMPTT